MGLTKKQRDTLQVAAKLRQVAQSGADRRQDELDVLLESIIEQAVADRRAAGVRHLGISFADELAGEIGVASEDVNRVFNLLEVEGRITRCTQIISSHGYSPSPPRDLARC